MSLRFLAPIALAACAAQESREPMAVSSIAEDAPERLRVRVVDDLGGPAAGTFVRVLECCHTERGPCGRVPVDADGRAEMEVCPGPDGLVHVTLTPDARRYRVAPVREHVLGSELELTLTVTRHESALEYLKPETR